MQSGLDAYIVYAFFNQLGSFRLVLAEKQVKTQLPQSSKSEFLGNFLANDVVLSDAQDKTSGLFNRGDILDLRVNFLGGDEFFNSFV